MKGDLPPAQRVAAAYYSGFISASVWTNPYPKDSDEGRHFVDGWVAGFREYGPRSEYEGREWPK